MTGRHRMEDRAQFIGGPYDGRHAGLPFPPHLPTPPYICTREGDDDWQHYDHFADNGYLYAGPCTTVEHLHGAPHDHPECE